ncbi:heparin/heparin-sulfate lyase HepB [Paenibacillus sp. 2TAB23]|uniref:heparin/heparin-sulfate lyase HepB n=1 Tax=Paenibacillus sp. 2TAB23 TaxID=3233004 RepID=UPI003F9A11C3
MVKFRIVKFLSISLVTMMLFSAAVNLPGAIPVAQAAAPDAFVAEWMHEAESIVTPSPWENAQGSGEQISGGTYLSVPVSEPKQDPPNGARELAYPLQIEQTGVYNIWLRVLAPSASADSFYLRAGSDLQFTNYGPSPSSDWQWFSVTKTLSAGQSDLLIKYREPGFGFDRFLVTSDTAYIPAGLGAHPGGDDFEAETLFEAEAGEVQLPWEQVDEANASGQRYVSVPATNDNPTQGQVPLQTAQPELRYRVYVPSAGDYHVQLRLQSPNEGADSFYMAVDNGNYMNPGPSETMEDWEWFHVKQSFDLSVGIHEIKIKYREAGLKIDQLRLTTQTSLPSDGGPVINPYPAPPVTPPEDEHPRLFARSGDLNGLRANLTKGEVKEAWDRLKISAERNYDGMLPALPSGNINLAVLKTIKANALMHLLYKDTPNGLVAGNKAVSMMNNYLNTVQLSSANERQVGETVLWAAVVYDWCYGLMDANQLADFREHIITFAGMMDIGYPPTEEGAVVGHGSEAQLMRDLLSAGVAIYDEDEILYNMAAGRFFAEYVPARNYAYPSHAHHQGDSYGPYRYQWDLFASWIFKRMDTDGGLSPEQQFVPYEWLYNRRPDGQLMRDGDSYWWNTPFGQYWSEQTPYLLSSGYYNDSYLRHEFLQQHSYNNAGVDEVWLILFGDPDLAGESEQSLPLTKYFDDPSGSMTARTSWAGGVNSSAVVATMKVGGTNFANHQHLDAGQFQIYYKGGLAIDSGLYEGTNSSYNSEHRLNYSLRTIAHNSMLVYDPNEVMPSGVINDGGQRYVIQEPDTLTELQDPNYEVADVLKHQLGPDETTPDYSYLKGDLTEAYSDKMEDFKRSFVFLNLKNDDHPAVLIVYDKVTASNSDFKKTWLLHSENEPVIEGDTVTLQRTDCFNANNNSCFNGKLVNRTLLPAGNDASILPVGGPGEAFMVNGINYPTSTGNGNFNAEAGSYRIEVSPSDAAQQKTNLFLNVMQVMDAEGGPEPLVTESISSDDMVGAKIGDRVVLFSKSGSDLANTASFVLPSANAETRVLVTDLSAGFWTVTKAGVAAAVQYEVTADEGTLYFAANGGGTFTLQRSTARTLPAPSMLQSLPVQEAQDPITLLVDNTVTTFGQELYLSGDQITLPYQRLASVLNLSSSLQGSQLTMSKAGSIIVMTVGSQEATVDGIPISLHAPVTLRNNEVYIPLEVASFGGWATVKWDSFSRKADLFPVQSMIEYSVISVKDGTSVETAAHATDGKWSTVWSGNGPNAALTFDLGEERKVSQVDIAWLDGQERTYEYKLLTSTDGTAWTQVFNGESSLGSDSYESTFFAPVSARYIKLAGGGYASEGGHFDETAIREVRIATPYYKVEAVNAIIGKGEDAIDGNYNTTWVAEGDGSWIEFDLGEPHPIAGLGSAWHRGNERVQKYDVLVSDDKNQWRAVFQGQNSGTTTKLEDIAFTPPVSARYVRIVGHGNSGGFWNSLTEAVIYKPAPVDQEATDDVTVKLKDSVGNPLSGGIVSYYDGSWRTYGVTDASGSVRKELPDGNYTFVVSYEGTKNEKSQHIGLNRAVEFQTVSVNLQLKDSQRLPLSGGIASYYGDGWRSFGEAAGGEVRKELLPGAYTFAMTYAGKINEKVQDIRTNPTVVFQTVNTVIQLKDQQGKSLGGGTASYYAGGWQSFGETTGGEVRKELLPGTYTFAMTYEGKINEKVQDIRTDSTIIFRTVKVLIQLKDAQGMPLEGGSASYYAGGWRGFGELDGGEISKELLPGVYTFAMSFNGAVREIVKDIAVEPNVIFQFQ